MDHQYQHQEQEQEYEAPALHEFLKKTIMTSGHPVHVLQDNALSTVVVAGPFRCRPRVEQKRRPRLSRTRSHPCNARWSSTPKQEDVVPTKPSRRRLDLPTLLVATSTTKDFQPTMPKRYCAGDRQRSLREALTAAEKLATGSFH